MQKGCEMLHFVAVNVLNKQIQKIIKIKKPTEYSGFMLWRIPDSNRSPLACQALF